MRQPFTLFARCLVVLVPLGGLYACSMDLEEAEPVASASPTTDESAEVVIEPIWSEGDPPVTVECTAPGNTIAWITFPTWTDHEIEYNEIMAAYDQREPVHLIPIYTENRWSFPEHDETDYLKEVSFETSDGTFTYERFRDTDAAMILWDTGLTRSLRDRPEDLKARAEALYDHLSENRNRRRFETENDRWTEEDLYFAVPKPFTEVYSVETDGECSVLSSDSTEG